MFILPISHKPDWRHPPLVTILLVLVNCLVYFGFQTGDTKVLREAAEFHRHAQLGQIEFPRYVAYLRSHERAGEALEFEQHSTGRASFKALQVMERDTAFMALLQSGAIIRTTDPEYPVWRPKRQQLDAILARQITQTYAFVPARHDAITFLTCMFLHGGLDHLFGNMMVLAIVGFMVERVLGGRRFLLFYLLSGIGSAAISGLAHAGSTIPEVGASGAISGAMAMYTVLYGMQRIRFFYLLVFYFDTMEAPAIALLPLFIANEAYQLLANSHGHVNYMAHIGGLLTGALLTMAYRYRQDGAIIAKPAAEAEEAAEAVLDERGLFEADRQKAKKLLGALDFDKARQAYANLASRQPENKELALQFYHVARLTPDSAEFHTAATGLLDWRDQESGTPNLLRRILHEYLRLAGDKADLPPKRLATLAVRLSRHGYDDEGQFLAQMLLKRHPGHNYLPLVLLEVGKCLSRNNKRREAESFLYTIVNRFPDSKEAKMAVGLLA